VERARRLEGELKARRSLKDPYFWLTRCTETLDEQDKENPYKPFPQKEYIEFLIEFLLRPEEQVIFIEKSRTMMASWTVSAVAAWTAFTRPGTCVVFQSKDESRAVHDVDYAKTLWRRSIPELRERWKLPKEIDSQPYTEFYLSNDSRLVGIPGDPEKIRSEHPTIVVLDEAAHIPEGERSFNVAAGTRCPKIIALSSANPGWFQEITEDAKPAPWHKAA